ncbi:MAG: tetratricopeptide repeat protein [Nannocystaceae bacterium]
MLRPPHGPGVRGEAPQMRNLNWRSCAATLLTVAMAIAVAACAKDKAATTPPAETGSGGGSAVDAAKLAETAGLIEVANIDLGNGRFVSARKRAEEALAADPNNADAYAVLGAAQWRAGKYAASTEAYQKAVDLDPNNFGANQGLGRNLQVAGQHEDAIKLQDKLIKLEDGADDMQASPRFIKMWSHYALLDVDAGLKTADQIFTGVGGEQSQLNIVKAYAAYLRPLKGKGPLMEIQGDLGQTDLATGGQYKRSQVKVGGKSTEALWMEILDETRIDSKLAEKLHLEELAKVTPFGGEASGVVLIPSVTIGSLTVKNVPAITQDLEASYANEHGVPGIILGRQFLQRFASVTFDFPAGEATLTKDAGPIAGEATQLLFLDLYAFKVPAVKVQIDRHEHSFWAWFGNSGVTSATVTKKEYLKSGHRPNDVYPPDDEAGQKMVFLSEMNVGEVRTAGLGGIVLTANPPDATLGMVAGSGFELGGYLNFPLIKRWKVTYALPQGKLYIEAPPLPSAATE